MGNCVSVLKRKNEQNKAITLAIVGLDNAGKTTMCYVLTGEQLDPDLAPTVGFRNVKFSHSNFDVTVFDIGGGEGIRPIWKTYFGEVFGLMYVVDSSTPGRLNEAKETLRDTLEHPQVSGKPVLILANKVDKQEHMKENDITSGLLLDSVKSSSKCPSKLVMVSALKGVGNKMDKEIEKGLQWLFESIRNSLSSLEPRIETDMKSAKEAREKEREERKARVKKQREEREKAEELERTKLGLTKKADSDEDDIIVGDPFKALDINKLNKKEQELKEEKRQIQERKKQLAKKDEMMKGYDKVQRASDGNLDMSSTDHDITMKDIKISEDLNLRLEDLEHSTPNLLRRRNPASVLPPLEPIESQDKDVSKTTTRKKRKKKKLTDYNLQSNTKQSHGNDSDQETKVDALISIEKSSNVNVHDENPQINKPKKTRSINFKKFNENGEEIQNDGVSSPYSFESNEENNRTLDSVSHGSGDSSQRNKSKKISRYNLDEPSGQETNESIDNSSANNLDDTVSKSQKRLKKMKSKRSDRVQNSLTNLLSDEENNSYASHNSLKDTLRHPLSPTYVEELRNTSRSMYEQSKNRSNSIDYNRQSAEISDGVGNVSCRGSKGLHSNGDAGNNIGNLGNSHPHNVSSPNKDEGQKTTISEKSRRKKKHNFLRSNKITPSDDETIKSTADEVQSTPLESLNSKSSHKVRSPPKNRNTTVTTYQRNISHDSDFGTKWGLAEDLPAVDGGYRVPNFDLSEEGDAVL